MAFVLATLKAFINESFLTSFKATKRSLPKNEAEPLAISIAN